ncbi:hypothetical protein [Actinomycetospora sp. CA-053990]|uniref:hypothetical protein n=1 Tax=Actinomycetospora sp. CA-053990 TaxID=3239891 RepID=UPI003D8B947F
MRENRGLLRATTTLVLATAQPLSTRAARWTGIAVKALRRRQAPVATAAVLGGVTLATSSAVGRTVTARR